ncbi:MAG TPA: hypothetical protein VFD74_05300 [Thermoleophilia bacterium]|nr:hypothetical protein [Thermoleophilia bacterium]
MSAAATDLKQVIGVLKATDKGFHDGTITLVVSKRLGSVVGYRIQTQEPDELTRAQREIDRLMRERPQAERDVYL